MPSRKLTLRAEALSDLSSDELHSVAGAASGLPCEGVKESMNCNTVVTYTVLPTGCMCTGMWPTLRFPCTEGLTDMIAVTGPCG